MQKTVRYSQSRTLLPALPSLHRRVQLVQQLPPVPVALYAIAAPYTRAGFSAARLTRRVFSPVAGAAMSTPVVLSFTPQHAALGGAILGISVVANLLFLGRVLGISGVAKGLVQGQSRELWRWAFVIGLMGASPLLATLLPASFETMPASVSVLRSVVSGLLVGLGTALGNGCTSGHGICGNSRLSVRSMAYTATFMLAGALAATLSNAAAALNIAPVAPQFQALSAAETSLGVQLLAGAALLLLGVAALHKFVSRALHRDPSPPPSARTSSSNLVLQPNTSHSSSSGSSPRSSSGGGTSTASAAAAGSRSYNIMQALSSLAIGAVFSAGLAVSGMTRPSKVVGFLSVLAPSWDASLMFVMASAIGVSIFAFQAVMGRWFKLPPALQTPLMAKAYTLPSTSRIDAQLLTGGVLFGTGWGLSGMCPGPAMVVAASTAASLQVWLYLASMLAGMKVEMAAALENEAVIDARMVMLIFPGQGANQFPAHAGAELQSGPITVPHASTPAKSSLRSHAIH